MKQWMVILGDTGTVVDDAGLAEFVDKNAIGIGVMDRMYDLGVGDFVQRESAGWKVSRLADRCMTYAECVAAIRKVAPADQYWTIEIETSHHVGKIETIWKFYCKSMKGDPFVDARNADDLLERVTMAFDKGNDVTDLDTVGAP